MLCDFNKIFKRIDELKKKPLSQSCPCNDCSYRIYHQQKWYYVPHYFEHPPTKECEHCAKHIAYIVDCMTKLAWYEKNDERLKEK